MTRYIITRIFWLIIVLFVVSFVTFSLMHLVPGGPWDREKALAPQV
ncbi:MAG: ABC transporter permease, partial [Dehalococcoidales bacterium]|nr:ABC transporter permease [Dehalococcoidales bacterium]